MSEHGEVIKMDPRKRVLDTEIKQRNSSGGKQLKKMLAPMRKFKGENYYLIEIDTSATRIIDFIDINRKVRILKYQGRNNFNIYGIYVGPKV